MTLGLPDDVAKVLVAAWPRPVRVEQLAERTGLSVPRLLGALTQAKVAGVLAESVEGVRLRRAP
jgi:DNA processing protein